MHQDEDPQEEIFYEVDEETQTYLKEALEMLAIFIDLQCSEDARSNLEQLVETLAHRFGLPYGRVEITENEEGGLSFSVDGGETSGTLDIPNLETAEEATASSGVIQDYTSENQEELIEKGPGKNDTIH